MPANHANHWKTLLAGTLGAAAVFVPGVAQAQQLTQPQQVAQASGPVTAISELSDVQPTDWAFQALQSLVERYGCIAGYPDRTYRGNRAMTRYEFAAGMNACLDRINELIAAGLADKVSKEDLATLQRLQEEFAAELAALKGRVDALEVDVKDLQSKVFNPVTKLRAQAIVAIVGSALSDDRVIDGVTVAEQDAANVTLPYRVRLNFDASFVGNDRLRIRLQSRNAEPEFFTGDPGITFGGGGGGTFVLDDFYYRFRAFESVSLFAGFNSVAATDFFEYAVPFDAISDFADAPNSTGDVPSGAAFGFGLAPGDQFTLTYGYTSDTPQAVGDGFGDSGLFGGTSSHAVELGFTPTETIGIYLQFASTYFHDATDAPGFLLSGTQDSDALFFGPLFVGEEAVAGTSARVNAFSVAANWEITPRIIFSGWFTTGNIDYQLPNVIPAGTIDPGDEDFNGFLVGLAFPDLFVEGANAGVVIGQPIVNDDAVVDRPFMVDVYYSFPVNDYITLTPGAYFISNPNGGQAGDNDPTIGVGALRATFSF
jgi:hypothetical protein